MTEYTIVKTLFLKATPERVWSFLTDRKKLATWFHEGKEDLKAGGKYAVFSNSDGKEGESMCYGDVTVFDPFTKLAHTFSHDYLGGVETLCEWELVETEEGTILTLRHSGFEKAAEAFALAVDHDKGWDEHFIRLRRVTV